MSEDQRVFQQVEMLVQSSGDLHIVTQKRVTIFVTIVEPIAHRLNAVANVFLCFLSKKRLDVVSATSALFAIDNDVRNITDACAVATIVADDVNPS